MSNACPCCPEAGHVESRADSSHGKEANREDYHNMGDALIGEVYPSGDAELRTEAPGSSKAAAGPGNAHVEGADDISGSCGKVERDSKDDVNDLGHMEMMDREDGEERDRQPLTQEQYHWVQEAIDELKEKLKPKKSIFQKTMDTSLKDVISILSDADDSKISNLGDDDGWVEIEITVGSGACDTVMPTNMFQRISILQTEDSRRQRKYEVANGAYIVNKGERKCLLMFENSGIMKKITFQCADVHKPLLAISKVADLGYDCTLGKDGGELKDKVTG